MVAYFVAGRLGLYLAIPPGFASAVWPASGVALATVMLLQRWPALIGIGLGSFLINLGLTSNGYHEIHLATLLPAGGIAMGAMLQAWVGLFLFSRLIGLSSQLDAPQDILRFSLIVALVGCLTAASVGVTVLYYSSIIAAENYLFSWLTWWVGDTIGVLLFTPIILILFSHDAAYMRGRKQLVVIPTLLVFTGALVLFFSSMRVQHEQANREISSAAKNYFQLIEERLVLSKSRLSSFSAFFHVQKEITQQDFNRFAEKILAGDHVFQGVGWTEIVSHNDRSKVENRIRNEGFPEFSFMDVQSDGSLKIAKEYNQYYPVLYIYPHDQNRKAFGLNLSANKQRLEALVRARQTGQAYATAPVRLVQDTESQFAYIVYVPVYRVPDAGHKQFRGYVSGVFRLNDLFGDLLTRVKDYGFGMVFYDVSEVDEPFLLLGNEADMIRDFDVVKKTFDLSGRKVGVQFYATKHFIVASKDWTSWSLLTGGLLISALLQSFILVITGATENTRREVERKTMDLNEARLAAEAANRSKSEFTSNMSHEIRTPLNAIVGLINLCLKKPLSREQQHYLEQCKLASATLLSLVNQVLDFSKIEAGKLEAEQTEFMLESLFEKIVAMFSIQAEKKGIEFLMELPPQLPDRLIGDPLRIEQVLMNLCGNAVKFTEQGYVKLVVDVREEAGRVKLLLSVQDTGIGISEELQRKLFHSYIQADTSTTRRFGGSGLGLTISKQLVELMGGRITLSSQLDVGSRFDVELPLTLSSLTEWVDASTLVQSGLPEEDKDDQLAPQTHALSGVSVLLAEDVAINQMIACSLLESQGATVEVASTGVEVLHKLRKKTFDVILMDIQMPEMDGFEATRQIRQMPGFHSMPIIAMTANAMSSDIEDCLAAGMNDHLGKPFEEAEIVEKILAQLPHNA